MTTDLKKLLLLDVGGTFIKCSDGREIPVDSDGSSEDIAAAFRQATFEFCKGAEEACATTSEGCPSTEYGIAVAIPGPFDYTDGIFLMKHKFASVYGESFRKVAAVPDCVQLRFAHDVNVMLEGEMKYGNGRGWKKGALVTLGTGLGFSMSIDGQVLKKPTGSPLVSIFSLPYRDGVLEDYASKRAFMRIFASLGGVGAQTVREIADLAKNGDTRAQETFRKVGETVASTIAPILDEHGIECLLFGGQISRSFSLMESPVRDGLSKLAALKHIGPVSDFSNATFNGLRCLFDA